MMAQSATDDDESDKTRCSFECIANSKAKLFDFSKNSLEMTEIVKQNQVPRHRAVMANVACSDCESELCGLSAVKKCDDIVSRMAEKCKKEENEGENSTSTDEKETDEKENVKIGFCINEKFPCFENEDCLQYTKIDSEGETDVCMDDPENIDWDPCSIADRTIDESKTKQALKASFRMPENDFKESNEPPQMLNFAPEDTTSEVDKAIFKDEMSVEVSQERGLADELQSKIDYQRWLSFAKSNRTGCDSFPFCNHIPNPPPLMPHPLDLSVPRVGVKYPYVPPMRGGAPKYRWDLSQYPAQMDKSQSVPDGKGGSSWLEPPGGSVMTPGAGYGMSVQHSPIEDSVLRNMYDVGEKVSEQETNPYV